MTGNKEPIGKFCEIYGNTARNRVLQHLLEGSGLDFGIGDIARQAGLSRPKVYDIISALLSSGQVKPTRIVGRTQLYMLVEDHPINRLLMRDFRECLRLVVEEHDSPGMPDEIDVNPHPIAAKTVLE